MGRFHFHDSAQKIGCRLSGLTCPDKHFSGHLCPDKLRTFGFGVVRENLRENVRENVGAPRSRAARARTAARPSACAARSYSVAGGNSTAQGFEPLSASQCAMLEVWSHLDTLQTLGKRRFRRFWTLGDAPGAPRKGLGGSRKAVT